jgi:hypothetical protein
MGPQVAGQVNLTDEQKEKFQALQQEMGEQMRDLFQGGFNEEAQKKMAELRKTNREKAMNLLTEQQKAIWKGLTGAPFMGEVNFFGGGRRGKQ